MQARAYILATLLTACLGLSAIAGLNLAMDPYGVGDGGPWRLRPPGWSQEQDRLPDRGLAGRAASARRGGASDILIGTSRTMHGFAPAAGRINAGLTNASFDEERVVARAAAAGDSPPDRLFIEAAALLTVEPDRRGRLAGPTPVERLLSTVATESSLRVLIAPRPYVFTVTPESEAARRSLSARPVTAYGETTVAAYLERAMIELRALCRTSGAASVLYEPPIGPDLIEAPEVRAAVAERVRLYRRAIEGLPSGSCRPRFVDLSGLSPLRIAGAADRRNWHDNIHFKPVVGEAVLRALRTPASPFGHALRRHPLSQRCAGSESIRGRHSIDTVNAWAVSGRGKLNRLSCDRASGRPHGCDAALESVAAQSARLRPHGMARGLPAKICAWCRSNYLISLNNIRNCRRQLRLS